MFKLATIIGTCPLAHELLRFVTRIEKDMPTSIELDRDMYLVT